MNKSVICGIDEAGRGPLAGPLVVAGVVFEKRVYKLDDSKALSPRMREELFDRLILATRHRILIIDNQTIDEKGISWSISYALEEILTSLKADQYIFDGNSRYGIEKITPIIKADKKIKEVMAASILAKVIRDRVMCDLSQFYPVYNFCKHKGYGTKEHIEAIKRYGLSPLHRKSFRPKALQPTLFEI